VRSSGQTLRNPGPSWGYRVLSWARHDWPEWLYRAGIFIGVWLAVLSMPRQRRYSKEYLTVVLRRKVRMRDCFNHFRALTESLVFKLEFGHALDSANFHYSNAGNPQAFASLVQSDRPALFGTFHVGHSDLIGCMLSGFDRKVRMVREQVGNSYDLKVLERIFGQSVEFVWVNQGESMLFALKSAAEDGVSLALQCDREEHGSRHRTFDFLGARRRFPVTIYHLAFLFKMPVVFSFGFSVGTHKTEVVCSDVFEPAGDSKREMMEAGYAHFQGVLALLESMLYVHPFAWFNFLPLNTEADDHVT